MKAKHSFVGLLFWLLTAFCSSSVSAQTGTWSIGLPSAVCAGQETQLQLNVGTDITAANYVTVDGGNVIAGPSKNGNVISLTVRWGNQNDRGSVVVNLTRTVTNQDGTTSTVPVDSNPTNCGLRNFYSRAPQQINGTSTYSLPLCSGGSPITLSVPVETYTGIPSETIAD
ncbi:hypothetical protein Q5H93_03170 [Hymenobacter sp. ASUV-10]|uniref:Gliding motility-associated C-terminal domain-containing protein n=1 Tax=Hymenobacter aranciens TaxID=3063996 RepID=A0ABT9B628_9BACT|nr:hypothetical protein [Hymenobacter sp. ASUV-10]MDO7873720.1 hypothetical protein [Hymenobacter sp. ASUV-10]